METDTGDAVKIEEASFIVVEFKRAINQHYHLVCVPRTWITCPMRGLKVAIGYPAEDEDTIAQRVKNKEPVNKNWQTYIGEIKYEIDQHAVGHLLTICGRNSAQIEDKNYQKLNENAIDGLYGLPTVCGENSEPIEHNSNEKPNEDAVAYSETICARTSEPIEDNSNEKPNENDGLSTICAETSSKKIGNNSNTIKVITEPEHPLKLRIKNLGLKLNQKSDKKKSEKKHHKKHSKGINHISKHWFMKQLSLTYNTSERSSPNSPDARVGTESYMSPQSNCKRSESSPKSQESERSNSVNSSTETGLIKNEYKQNNNIYSYFSKRKIESVAAEKENYDDMLIEDQQLVENMYMNMMSQFQYLETAALEMKKSQLIAMENKKALDKLAVKYRIQVHVTDSIEREKEGKSDPVEEEILQDDEMETQDDNEGQVAEKRNNTSEENLLEEEAERFQESKSGGQAFTSQEVIKYKKYIKKIDKRTLKHPRSGNGLIQIGGNSRTHISAEGLEKAKHASNDVLQFARALFREVFTMNALRTHSMNGYCRPALPLEVTRTLQDYAKKYGETVGWVSVTSQKLENNLCRMLTNCRRYRS